MTTVWAIDVASLFSCVGPSIIASVFYSVKMRLICVAASVEQQKAKQNQSKTNSNATHTHTSTEREIEDLHTLSRNWVAFYLVESQLSMSFY